MATIFNPPSQVKELSYNWSEVGQWQEEEKRYIAELRSFLKNNGYGGKNSGEIIQFPVADSYAQYMVASMRPLVLIHLPLGDAWSFQYAHLLNAEEVQKKINADKSLREFLESRK